MFGELAAVPLEDIDPDRLDMADDLGHQLIRFIRLISRVGAHFAAAQKDGVETAAYALLACLVMEGPRRTTALAEAVHSDISTVSRQSATLVRLGLVERRPDPQDGRACLLAATPEGERVFDYNRKQRDAHIARMLGKWDDSEVRELVSLLDRFNTDFEVYRPQMLGNIRRTTEDEGGPTR
ncbi:MAG: MarR family winged helix-turn-helix transcriptional regulator [Sciscionella sp.]